MSSYEEAPPGKSGNEGGSLAARRARLRGSLAKQALPPDPYSASSLSGFSKSKQEPVKSTSTDTSGGGKKEEGPSVSVTPVAARVKGSSQSSQSPQSGSSKGQPPASANAPQRKA